MLVWYQDNQFKNPIGFQIGFKKSPFNTDEELFLTSKPEADSVVIGKLQKEALEFPTPKWIQASSEPLPEGVILKIRNAVDGLPRDVQKFLNQHLGQFYQV